ncbi:MAG: DUF454 family protein [Alphaproteobacteria bacterium]|nr:DUF454 family protein [Alphaproteobacteria bacterium]
MSETSARPPEPPNAGGAFRPLYLAAGLVFVALGIAGYILPVMPGTVFLILAAGCFARSSPRLEHWLVTHPKLGPTVVAWRKTGAIPRPIKLVAIISMAISMTLVCLSPAPVWVDWLVAAILVGSALFVGTRPAGPRTAG